MRVVLSDTSPLHYLVLIGEAGVLASLYGRVLIPLSVATELNQPRTPVVVREWISHPPEWIDIVSVGAKPGAPVLADLDAGERDAILLALEVNADLILIDERDGVREAIRLGLVVTGTLGVLDRAAKRKLLDLPAAVARLRATNFRVHAALLDRLLEEDAHRQRDNG